MDERCSRLGGQLKTGNFWTRRGGDGERNRGRLHATYGQRERNGNRARRVRTTGCGFSQACPELGRRDALYEAPSASPW